MKTTRLPIRNLMTHSRHPAVVGVFIPLVFVCFVLSSVAQAVTPAPDGGYPGANTAEGTRALFNRTTGVWNTANGFEALYHDYAGSSNTATGIRALFFTTYGEKNTGYGALALYENHQGGQNVAVGYQTIFYGTTAGDSTAIGYRALYITARYPAFHGGPSGVTAVGSLALYGDGPGSGNVALGFQAGFHVSFTDLNIHIANTGDANNSDLSTIRLGTTGEHSKTFIAGIRGVSTGVSNAVPVVIDSAGQLGTMSSSRRFKNEIKPMDQSSESILALEPVRFHYKSDATNTPHFGLIAEEVAQVDPNLVVDDADGEIYTVRYDAINEMLLNEFLKEHDKAERLKQQFQATVAQRKEQIQMLTARLNEQASQIQKVSAQLELQRPGSQMALNDSIGSQ
jgi:hypothetical protein